MADWDIQAETAGRSPRLAGLHSGPSEREQPRHRPADSLQRSRYVPNHCEGQLPDTGWASGRNQAHPRLRQNRPVNKVDIHDQADVPLVQLADSPETVPWREDVPDHVDTAGRPAGPGLAEVTSVVQDRATAGCRSPEGPLAEPYTEPVPLDSDRPPRLMSLIRRPHRRNWPARVPCRQ